MRTIASLLFGREAGELLDLITGEGGSEREAADRARRSGEWCGSTPGRGSLERAVPSSGGGRRVIIRDGRI
jgi:hypothetical protein